MVLSREHFAALDQLTLAEIEAMFGGETAVTEVKRHVGRKYEFLPGATFFELDDLTT